MLRSGGRGSRVVGSTAWHSRNADPRRPLSPWYCFRILGREGFRPAFVGSCEEVMAAKEAAEREREESPYTQPRQKIEALASGA